MNVFVDIFVLSKKNFCASHYFECAMNEKKKKIFLLRSL